MRLKLKTLQGYKIDVIDLTRVIILKITCQGYPTGCNKKVVGMVKDEAGGKIIEEFVERKTLQLQDVEGERGKQV